MRCLLYEFGVQTRGKLKCCILLGWPQKAQRSQTAERKRVHSLFVDLVTAFCLLFALDLLLLLFFIYFFFALPAVVSLQILLLSSRVCALHMNFSYAYFFQMLRILSQHCRFLSPSVCSRHFVLLQRNKNKFNGFLFGFAYDNRIC